MRVNGTLINYYFHCKRQCYLHGNRLNLEDNSENVKVGKAIHEEKSERGKNTEITIDNIKLDKLTAEYLVEVKKSDADVNAATWQLMYYLKVLRSKGIERKGKLEFIEKNKTDKKIIIVELDEENEFKLDKYVNEIEELIVGDKIPEVLNKGKCKKCAYYEYCYI
ncbi:CRISPR-associated protein Cas4 [Clostridium sp.]|uniref:CRISPR-associated protein Cas4 n=1 Tax=Clostridium sp. TaxID=1506 RepID=UPI001B51E0B1|nr:CRISPR-associated protein Cas4 [Clostridium sp.]MBP3916844.1 CRISPR-associated protein Cas4 [Clostridium sp.]MBQ9013855.1 CRISPR-associated protein Cas4 [Bacilli bacterium]